MSYWNKILEEVLNKHDPHCAAIFTNARESFNLQESKPSRPTKVGARLRDSKKLAKKRTQVIGKVKKYTLGKKHPDVYFTKREAQVIYCFMRGKTTLQTAGLLKLSRRTIEFYLNNMKVKLGCRFKSDLINLVIRSDFLKLVDANLKISCQ